MLQSKGPIKEVWATTDTKISEYSYTGHGRKNHIYVRKRNDHGRHMDGKKRGDRISYSPVWMDKTDFYEYLKPSIQKQRLTVYYLLNPEYNKLCIL